MEDSIELALYEPLENLLFESFEFPVVGNPGSNPKLEVSIWCPFAELACGPFYDYFRPFVVS